MENKEKKYNTPKVIIPSYFSNARNINLLNLITFSISTDSSLCFFLQLGQLLPYWNSYFVLQTFSPFVSVFHKKIKEISLVVDSMTKISVKPAYYSKTHSLACKIAWKTSSENPLVWLKKSTSFSKNCSNYSINPHFSTNLALFSAIQF